MAIFRKVHVSFWRDPFVRKLTGDQRLFYLYLMTNPNTTQCGIYEIDFDTVSFELGYSIDTVSILFKYFEKADKIKYSTKTQEVALKNWKKYNGSGSPKVQACISGELKKVKDTVLIQYLYSMDTQSQEEQEKEEEQEKDVVPTIDNIFENFTDRQKKLFEMLRRAVSYDFTDADIITEIGKIENRYPEIIINKSGALINTWAGNMKKEAEPKPNSKKVSSFI